MKASALDFNGFANGRPDMSFNASGVAFAVSFWGPAPVTLTYQWKANGVAITGAPASTYKPVAGDAGKTLTVTVTGSKAGYTTFYKTSGVTPKIAN